MATRIRVRKGDTEVEYEGSEQFLKTELASLLRAASAFPAGSDRQAGAAAADTASPEETSPRTSGRKTPTGSRKTPTRKSSATRASAGETSGGKTAGRKASAVESASPVDGKASGGPDATTPAASPTAEIAAKIGCKHGTDLVLAAAAQLNLGAGQRSFSRAALLGEMKTARQYYQPVYGKNLSRYLRNLIKERQLNEPRPGSYALTAPARRELGKILAE